MLEFIQFFQILVSLAFVAYVLMGAFGFVLFITQVLFPRLSEWVLSRLAGPGGDAKVDG